MNIVIGTINGERMKILCIFVVGIVGSNYPMKKVSSEPFPMTLSEHHLNLNIMQKEIWKDIEGYEELYRVNPNGRVRGIKRGKDLAHANNGYYKFVGLCKNGKSKYMYVHRLVALSFIPNPKNKPEVNHIDGDKSNNYVDNLEWCTTKENCSHAVKTGLRNHKGEKNIKAVLTAQEVIAIRQVNYNKISQARIARIYGVYYTAISKIIYRKTWKHI